MKFLCLENLELYSSFTVRTIMSVGGVWPETQVNGRSLARDSSQWEESGQKLMSVGGSLARETHVNGKSLASH